MTYIAIDYSLNSPGICIYYNKQYYFVGYLKPKTGTKKEQKMQIEINKLNRVHVLAQPDFKNDLTYSSAEFAKINRYIVSADNIINKIKTLTPNTTSYIFAFEGTSYGSSNTNNLVDMAAGAAILKLRIIEQLQPKNIATIAPSTIKKSVNKGNMSKLAMWPFFLANNNLPLVKYCNKHENTNAHVNKIPKPLDDFMDAYFLLRYLISSK